MKTNQSKNIYVSPKIEAMNVELEQGIAAGSAAPGNTISNDPQESWDNADDDNRLINW
ncbi:MAG: hypothetical protein K0R59_1196 [Sphingobacterium sp.]|jgi:hypothetical protein|uniref:hypothetical protein n=1 Tax=unclassified Sphingobacterium TaxID=2609468 RepID=UPI00158A6E27|nr:hypothetical protein [Sphingobacterium sp. CZ-UAM]MDF2515900.1 hypothetical protein [Sphingobacterium sp.]